MVGMISEGSLKQAVDILSAAQRVCVLSGAGISKESGIPTFREAQTGLWARYDPQQLATPQAFRRNPDLVWSWYMYRRDLVSRTAPNPGHEAIAALERLLPGLVVLTQNVDGLHRRAGSEDVVELHGSLTRYKCAADCRGLPTHIDLDTLEHGAEHAPRCPYCQQALVRPDVVWFGEMLPEAAINRAYEVAAASDVMLVVGTSGVVHPAASLPGVTKRAGGRLVEVNLNPSQITPSVDVFLQGPSGEVLPALLSAFRRAPRHGADS